MSVRCTSDSDNATIQLHGCDLFCRVNFNDGANISTGYGASHATRIATTPG